MLPRSYPAEEHRILRRRVVEGPFGLDVALSGEAARIKGVGGESPECGCLAPRESLDAANATYKAFLSAREFFGRILVGAKSLWSHLTSESMQTRMDSISLALTVCS
jgi:phosphotransacetylase